MGVGLSPTGGIAMWWMNRKHRVDGTNRRVRNYERERAVQTLKGLALFLIVFVVLGLALSPAVEPARVLEEAVCDLFGLCDGR